MTTFTRGHAHSNDLSKLETWHDIAQLLAGDRLLRRGGFTMEHNLWVMDYNPAQEPDAARLISWLIDTKLPEAGVHAIAIDLYQLLLDALDANNDWDDMVEAEADAFVTRTDMIDMLTDIASVRDLLLPAIYDAIEAAENNAPLELVLITGVGACYPFVRTHELLSEIETTKPVVLVFPGSFEPEPSGRTCLNILDVPAGPAGGYYRASSIFDM